MLTGLPPLTNFFALFIEPLSQCIRQNALIKGIDVHGDEQKLSLYADDILIYRGQPNKSLPNLMKILEDFGSLSGYKLNIKKKTSYDP